jgi:hypothetical protein
MAVREAKDGSWTFDIFNDLFYDPATCESPRNRGRQS